MSNERHTSRLLLRGLELLPHPGNRTPPAQGSPPIARTVAVCLWCIEGNVGCETAFSFFPRISIRSPQPIRPSAITRDGDEYLRMPKLLAIFLEARAQGTYDRLLKRLAKIALLILDDLGLGSLTEQQKQDLLEAIEERHGVGATIVTSQLSVADWT